MALKIKTILKGDPKLKVTNEEILRIAKLFRGKRQLAVGLPANSQPYPDGTSVIAVGTIHEFGGEIKNPGGVPYGFRTEREAEEGKVRFMAKGTGFLVLGKTQPHTISIPERSFLRSTVNEKRGDWLKLAEAIHKRVARKKGASLEQGLRLLGEQMQIDVQKKIDTGPFAPNAPAYAKIKSAAGKTKPLIVTGHLRGSIRWALTEV